LPVEAAAVSLLDALSETGFQASVIATYNCYFPFYEEVVLRRLLDRGCSNNILLVDAAMCAQACSSEDARPRRAGRDYTLIPVHLPGAFHPKLVVAVGKSKGVLFVGSHNMTLAGFGLNDELTNEFRIGGPAGRQDAGVIRGALTYLGSFVPPGLPDLQAILAAVKHNIPWLVGPAVVRPDDRILLTTSGQDQDLWGRIHPLISARPSVAFVSAPFFDRDLGFLSQLWEKLRPEKLIVGIDPESADIDPAALQCFAQAEFVNTSRRAQVPNRRDVGASYMHAKILWFAGSNGELLVSGSANPSRAAFLADGMRRNAEAVVVDRRKGAAVAIGLEGLVEAPQLESKDLERLAARHEERERNRNKDAAAGTFVLAVPTDHGFLLQRSVAPALVLDASAADGTSLGQVITSSKDGQSVIDAPVAVRDNARWLRGISSESVSLVVLVHRPEEVGRNIGGSRQRELRQALGALDEDPAQLETLLRITEKVIFDDDSGNVEDIARRGTRTKPEADMAPAPESLAVDAAGRRAGGRKRRLASGDILVLLDALLHRLGEGLSVPGPVRSSTYESPQDGDEEGGDDEAPPPLLYETLAKACRGKVGQLVRRMIKQLERAETSGARRAVVQLAAVLGVIQALRKVEQRVEWRSKRLKLVEVSHEWLILDAGAMALFWASSSLGPCAIKETYDESFQELSMATGLLAWLVWDVAIDVKAAVERTKPMDLEHEDEPWYPIQAFAAVAAYLAGDSDARDILRRAAAQTIRRGVNVDAWLSVHLGLADRLLRLVREPELITKPDREPRPGDLVMLGPEANPRIRIALRVLPSNNTNKIRVFDQEADGNQRQFHSTHVRYVAWWEPRTSSAPKLGLGSLAG
jgi:hypothetical protein